ncbi:DNA-formamidopyrimidine glycosylase family protein [Mycobacterium sp. HUMS_1102779]|uniref:DNA-formamidopyrimidine glycosylase family protein n=1 Tax=Mycobacterium sp. HUMS_1102779 TaxID=3383487 RepID=UPI00389A9D46
MPDVEGYRRELAGTLPGRRIRRVRVHDPGVLRNTTPQALGRRVDGHRFGDPRRHGKWLILPTDGPTLLIHSGMTGHPYHGADGAGRERHERLAIVLDEGELRYADLRKLRGVWLAAGGDDLARVTGPQGPDALGLGLRAFRGALAGRRGRLKTTLLDQSVIAGLGNLLVDELCWRARVLPKRPVDGLAGGDVRDEPEPHCPRCGAGLARGRVGGRTSLWCPRCQS